MDIREAGDRAILLGMDVFEGISASGLAFGAFVTSYCVYEGVSDMFQPDSPWESSPFTAVPGAVIMTGVTYGILRATQSARDLLNEYRAIKR